MLLILLVVGVAVFLGGMAGSFMAVTPIIIFSVAGLVAYFIFWREGRRLEGGKSEEFPMFLMKLAVVVSLISLWICAGLRHGSGLFTQ